jgi:hypothetical protein
MAEGQEQGEGKSQRAAGDPHTVAKDAATLIEARLAHEFNLAGHRMTWLVTSQAFLFAGWVQLLKAGDAQRQGADMRLLMALIPVIGFMTAVTGGFAVAGAMRNTDYLVTDRAEFDRVLGLRDLSPLRKSRWTRWAGQTPPGVLPSLFAVAWMTVGTRLLVGNTGCLSTRTLLYLGAALYLVCVTVWVAMTRRNFAQARREAKKKRLLREGLRAADIPQPPPKDGDLRPPAPND